MTGEHSLADAEQVLRKDGFHLLPANGNEVRIEGKFLSLEDVGEIKGRLKSIGFRIVSFMQQSWSYPSPKIEVLL
jgi:hypothetical protein